MAWWRRDHRGRTGRTGCSSGRNASDRRHPALQGAVIVAILGGVALAWHAVEFQLWRYATHLDRGVVTWDQVDLADAPAWMGDSVRRELQELVATWCGSAALDQESLAQAATRLDGSAWTESVQQIRRVADGGVRVTARYRRPIAVVQTHDGYRIIDARGILLPGLYLRKNLPSLGMPLIVGVRSHASLTGAPWRGPDLKAGIELVRVLEGDPLIDQITAIDVGMRDARHRVHVVLRTADGFVRWGLPPSESYPIEPDAGIKRRLLRRVAAEHGGRIDAGGRIVDIFDGAIYLHPTVRSSGLPAG